MIRRAFSLLCATLLLASCGDGSDSPKTETQVLPLNAQQVANISVQISPSQETILLIQSSDPLAQAMTVGTVIHVPQGIDPRFPLGVAGKVASTTTNADGTRSVTLSVTTLAETVYSSSVNEPAVTLGAEDFVGVLAPAAVKRPAGSTSRPLLHNGDKADLDGALIVRRARQNTMPRRQDSVLPGDGTVSVGSVELAAELKVADMVDDPTRLRPWGGGPEAKITVNLKLANLRLIQNHEYSTSLLGTVDGLKSLDMRLEGDFNAEIKFAGGAEVDLGYYSRAWKEVEDQGGKLLGISGKITGLDSKDKIGKFPLMGLVYSVPCSLPTGCPVALGATQTPLRQAKAGGLIIWVYVLANGTLALDGELGLAHARDFRFSVGGQKSEGGELDKYASFSHFSTGNVIEAPYLSGEIRTSARLGAAIDVDFFTFGLRLVNASFAIAAQPSLAFLGSFSHNLPDLGQPWVWQGNGCSNVSIGAGLIVALTANIGAEVKTPLGRIGTSLSYAGQWPTEDEIASPGFHGIPLGPLKTWYTARQSNMCFPTPVVTDMSIRVSGSTATITAAGTNLPDDLALTMTDPNECSGLKVIGGNTSAMSYSCTLLAGSSAPLGYQLTSLKAENLDASRLIGSLVRGNPPPPPLGVAAAVNYGQATISWDAVSGEFYNVYTASVPGVSKSNYGSLSDGTLFAGVTPPFTQTGLTNGKAYYFVVTAVSAWGESSESAEVTATPRTVLNDRILFLSQQDGNWEIYSAGFDGLNPINITNDRAADRLPSLSLQRDQIAFVSDRDGNNEIYVMMSDGANPRRLTTNSADDVFPVWSPDGKKIAFTSKRDGNNFELYVMDADGTNQRRLTNTSADESMPSWSPDSRRIAFVSERDGNEEIYAVNADGGSAAANLTMNSASDNIPFFSPDGQWISFVSNRGGSYDIWIMDTNGGNLRRLTLGTNNAVGWYAWSPNGTQIAFDSKTNGNYQIYVINFDGSGLVRLTTNSATDRFASWTWDGKKIVFVSNRTGVDQIWTMSPDGGSPVNASSTLTSVALPMASPVYQTGGGCFIATAAFGSYLEPEVVVLRQFRTKYLLTNDPGKLFVKYYYRLSPPMAKVIQQHDSLRAITRVLLAPLVYGIKYPVGASVVLLMFIFSLASLWVFRLKGKSGCVQ